MVTITTSARQFTQADVTLTGYIYADKSELVYDPPAWMRLGLQETASGYGKKLNSGYMILFCGKRYRVYVTIFSNAGTCWFTANGKRIVVA